MAIDLRKQQVLDADPKAIQQIEFTWNLGEEATMFFHYWRSKRNHFRFFTRICESIASLLWFKIISI